VDITYSKDKEFRLAGKNLEIAINPKEQVKADVILYSDKEKKRSPKAEQALCFDGPGEYEIKGSMITGIKISHNRKTAYSIILDNIKIAYLGDIQNSLSDEELDLIGAIDVLLISLADLTPAAVSKLIGQIEPKIIIPMDYTPEKLKAFELEMGSTPQTESKLKLSPKDFSDDLQKIVVLSS